MMHELFVLDNVVLSYVLFHKYSVDIKRAKEIVIAEKKKKTVFNDNGK